MSRSIKKPLNNNRWLRKPKGRKAAIIRGSRNKGIPPDSREDIRLSSETLFIWKYAKMLHKNGFSREETEKMIIVKFKVTYKRAHELTKRLWSQPFP
jgi:hypothetical protein